VDQSLEVASNHIVRSERFFKNHLLPFAELRYSQHSAGEPLAFDTSSVSKTNLLLQELVFTVPNPKSLIFIAAFLPQFIDSTRPLGLQFIYIVPTFLIITFSVTSVWELAVGNVRGLLQSQPAFQSVLRTAGGLMSDAGVSLALVCRGN